MNWDSSEGLRIFEQLAEETFAGKRTYTTIFGRVRNYIRAYLRDYQYSSSPIEEAFKTAFGKEMKMFNALDNDTKVAVTTTTAKKTRTCLFSNYNGGIRSGEMGMKYNRSPLTPN